MLYFVFEFIGRFKSYWKATYKQELQKQKDKAARNNSKSDSSFYSGGSDDSCGGCD